MYHGNLSLGLFSNAFPGVAPNRSAAFLHAESYRQVCGAVRFFFLIRCGAVRCGETRVNRTAPYPHLTKLLDFKDPTPTVLFGAD